MNFDFSSKSLDMCTIHGNCAQEPYANFINEYIVNEICDLIFYVQNLKKLNFRNVSLEKELVSTLAIINLNFDYHTDTLMGAIKDILKRKSEVEEFYNKACKENKKYAKNPQSVIKISDDIKISEIAKIGEKLFLKRQEQLSQEENTLYTIYLLLIKNLARNLNEILKYDCPCDEITDKFFDACNRIKINSKSKTSYYKKIKDLYQLNYDITNKKYEIYIENYGHITQNNLSFSSKKSKCIMISGNVLKDLDELLKAVKNENIDVYTHNGMIFAHQYQKFANNKNLIGHYQKNKELVKYDFVTFPGPVIIGDTHQNKLEGVYRGNIFTTNKIAPFGVSFIKDNDFADVVNIAKETAGFKKAHKKNSVWVGYTESEVENFLYNLSKDIMSGKYNSVLFVGLLHNEIDNPQYYEKLINNLKDKTFVISLAHELNVENSKHFNSFYDYNLALKLFNYLYKLKSQTNFSINVYITDCTSQIVPNIMMLNFYGAKNIFIPVCRKLPNTNSLEYILAKYFNTHITNYNLEEDLRILNGKDL